MSWVRAVQALREQRRPGVLVTVASARGHAPRDPGAKLVVADDAQWGTVGGGNLEATALARARLLIADGATAPETLVMPLTDHAANEHGQQCCGGEVTLLLDPLPVVPAVAVFGLGHVGLELARILSRHDLELHLVDSRIEALDPSRLDVLGDAEAHVHVHRAPVPEVVLGEIPPGTHVLVMTHDHAEDAALCDAALRCAHLGSVGLIGSSAKWRRFEAVLRREGHGPDALASIVHPIGASDVRGKDPATIALSVAVDLVRRFEAEGAQLRGAGLPRGSGR